MYFQLLIFLFNFTMPIAVECTTKIFQIQRTKKVVFHENQFKTDFFQFLSKIERISSEFEHKISQVW